MAFAAYAPEGADAERMVIDVGRRYGLKLGTLSWPPGSRNRRGNDQAIVAQELQKLALYLDASPQSPKELDHDALDAVGADLHEGDVARLADLALSGEIAEVADELVAVSRRRGGDSGGSRDCSGDC